MRKFLKIVLIVLTVFISTCSMVLYKDLSGRGSSPGAGGPIGIIILMAGAGAVRGIWKYNPEAKSSKEKELSDRHKLDKS